MRIQHIVWAALLVVFALGAALVGSAPCAVACIALIVLPVLGLIASKLASKHLDATFFGPATAQKATAVECGLSMSSASRIPLSKVQAVVDVRNLLTDQRTRLRVSAQVPPMGQAQVPFAFESDVCGRVELSITSLTGFDPLMLFGWPRRFSPRGAAAPADEAGRRGRARGRARSQARSQARLQSADPARQLADSHIKRVSVMPDLHEAFVRDAYSASPISDTTLFSPYKRGADASEVFGMHEYVPGDEVRRIHWKLSGKTDTLIVKEASLPLDNTILVLWDKSIASASPDPYAADAMAQALLGVCQGLAGQGFSFSVACNDVDSDSVVECRVEDEDDVYEAIGHMMTGRVGRSRTSVVAAYERGVGALLAARVICVCSAVSDDLVALARRTGVLALVCDGQLGAGAAGAGAAGAGDLLEVHFGAGGVSEALAEAAML